MFKPFVHRLRSRLSSALPRAVAEPRPDAFPTLEMTAHLLTTPSALMALTLEEAREVVRYMQPQRIARGTVFIREGDEVNTDFMALILEGEVLVESIVVSRSDPMTVTVLGPGSMHGEMGLLDGLPRSATCTAASDLSCAVLTRQALLALMDEQPRLGSKLIMAIAMRIGDRLRDNTSKLKKFVQLTRMLQQELHQSSSGS